MILYHRIVFIILLSAVVNGSSLYCQNGEKQLPANIIEGYYQLNYSSVVSEDIIVLLSGQKLFIPLSRFLQLVKVYHEVNYLNRSLEGFFITKDTAFNLDFRNLKVQIGKREYIIANDEYLDTQFEFYVDSTFIDKTFNIKLSASLRDLSIRADSRKDLPILLEYKRRKLYRFANGDEDKYETLKFDRERRWLNGGVLDYVLFYSKYRNDHNFAYSASLGLEALGGDLIYYSNGGYSPSLEKFNYRDNYRWRYYLGDNPFLTQFLAGNLNNYGYRYSTLPSTYFKGFQISNELTKTPAFFSDIIIEDQTEPGWLIELYRNGVLIEHQVADPNGNYKFVVPVNYGNSNIELKFYGTKGEYFDRAEILNLPSEFLKPGEIKYTLSYGDRQFDSLRMIDGRLSFGITQWLSNVVDISRIQGRNEYDFSSRTSLWLWNPLVLSMDYIHNKLTRGIVNFWHPFIGSYELSYTKYKGISELNPFNYISNINSFGSVSNIFKMPLSVSYYGNLSQLDRQMIGKLNLNLFTYFYPFSYRLRYQGEYIVDNIYNRSISNNIVGNELNYQANGLKGFFKILNGSRIGGSMIYDFGSNRITNLGFQLENRIIREIYTRFYASWDLVLRNKVFFLNVQLDLNQFRSLSDAKYFSDKDIQLSQSLEGNVGYNSGAGKIFLANPTVKTNVGNGGAIVRLFLDKNLNEQYDKGESIIPDVKMEIPRASFDKRSSDYYTYAYNLVSYSRYNVYIDKESIGNPLWIPKFSEFSFIADPNTFKSIDIPCYAAAVLEGSVYSIKDNKKAPQKGVKIHVLARDSSFDQTLPVFSDGSFYYMGAPPGDYTAWVDSLQLEILKCDSRPPKLEFTVKKTTDGDYIGGLNFELIPRGSVVASKPDKIENKQQKNDTEKSTQVKDESKAPSDESSGGPLIIKGFEELALNQKKIFSFDNLGASNLTREMKAYLDLSARYMKQDTLAEISITGYADSSGNIMKVQDLSNKRAEIAAQYITKRGISDSRIFAKGLGAEYPLYIGNDKLQSAKNRRIEILLLAGSSVLASRNDTSGGKMMTARLDTSGKEINADSGKTVKPDTHEINLPKVKDLDIALQNFRPSEQAVFTYDKSTATVPTKSMKEYLELAALYMQTHPECEISIVGHSDNFGSLEETQAVSERRAQGAARYLIDRGINKDRILVRGEGSRAPAASNMTPEGRQKNRRVEIRILE